MKKTLALVLLLAMALCLFAACGGGEEAPETPAGENGTQPTYKETMVPFDEIVAGNRIVIMQNTMRNPRDGFYTAETAPVAEQIDYNGAAVAAYPLSLATAFLTNGVEGTVTVYDAAGKTTEVAAADFEAAYAILEFDSGVAPVLYNADADVEVADFAYALTEGGEAIYSAIADSVHPTVDILTACLWDTAKEYRVVATDKFHFPVPAENMATGEVRGTISGAVNASFPDYKIASGKLGDIVYIEDSVE